MYAIICDVCSRNRRVSTSQFLCNGFWILCFFILFIVHGYMRTLVKTYLTYSWHSVEIFSSLVLLRKTLTNAPKFPDLGLFWTIKGRDRRSKTQNIISHLKVVYDKCYYTKSTECIKDPCDLVVKKLVNKHNKLHTAHHKSRVDLGSVIIWMVWLHAHTDLNYRALFHRTVGLTSVCVSLYRGL